MSQRLVFVDEDGMVLQSSKYRTHYLKAAAKKKAAPKKAKAPKKKACVSKGKNRCDEGKVCFTEDGECLEVRSTGLPKGSTKMKADLGDDFYYDEKNGLVGRKADVLAAVAKLKVPKAKAKAKAAAKAKAPATKAKAKAKKAKQSCIDETDPLLCKEEDVCNSVTGRCVKSTGVAAKNKWKLEVDGRIIVGDEDTLTKLQETLGGDLSAPIPAKKGRPAAVKTAKKSSPKKPSPKKVSPKKPSTKKPSSKKVSTKKTKAAPKEKVRSCADINDPIECDILDVCNADTGKCVRDGPALRKNLFKLVVDGRVILGAQATLIPLQRALGGVISNAEEEETEPIEPQKVPSKKKASSKATVAPKKSSPTKKTKSKKIPELPVVASTAAAPPLVKLSTKREDIRAAFEKCLQGLGE